MDTVLRDQVLELTVERLEELVEVASYTDPTTSDWWRSWSSACGYLDHRFCGGDGELCYELAERYRVELAVCFCGTVG